MNIKELEKMVKDTQEMVESISECISQLNVCENNKCYTGGISCTGNIHINNGIDIDMCFDTIDIKSITADQFFENVRQTFANKGLDFNAMYNVNSLSNGAEAYNATMQGKINPVSSDSYTTNNKTMNVNIDKVIADDPIRFTQQMEQIADERFKENFPPAMNQFGRDLRRYQMNHSN